MSWGLIWIPVRVNDYFPINRGFICLSFRLYEVGQTPEARGLLDFGIYKNRHWKVKVALVRECFETQYSADVQ